MLTPPDGLPEAALTAVLGRRWDMTVAAAVYRPVGWGSHHWAVTDAAGSRWFVTADELAHKRMSEREPLGAAFGRLRASLAAATELRASGAAFVVAPVRTGDGEPLARVDDRFGVAVYPFVDGQSFDWGEFSSPEHRLGVLRLVAAVHTAPAAASRPRWPTTSPCRAGRRWRRPSTPRATLPAPGPTRCGRPSWSGGTRRRSGGCSPGTTASCHGPVRCGQGGPHPWRAPPRQHDADRSRGWVLIDWDTVLVAPPERDLWLIDPGDGTMLDAYASATGVSPVPLFDAYRLRWDIADIAAGVGRFRRPHAGSPEDDKAWGLLANLIERLAAGS